MADAATPVVSMADAAGATALFGALADGAYVTDVNRRILYWNRAAERITGWPAEEVLGQTCADNVLNHLDPAGNALCNDANCPLKRAIETGVASPCPLMVFAQHRRGHRIPVEVSVAPMCAADGSVIGGIQLFRDLSPAMDDLRRARMIQSSQLACAPVNDPRLAIGVHTVPHELVGGDFFHLERLDADRIVVMVADVSGHGVAAALFTLHLRAIWEHQRDELEDPSRFMGLLNARLHRFVNKDGYFATAVLLVVNAGDGTAQIVQAGHGAPLRFRAGGGDEAIDEHGPALGLLAAARYHATQVQLRPGDLLLVYTDGASKVSGPNGVLGEAGLRNLVKRELKTGNTLNLASVEAALQRYSGMLRLADDLTLVSLRYTPEGAARVG